MTCSFEVATGHNLQGVANVDDKRTWLVRYIVPLLILAPDLKAGDRNGEEQSGQTEVSVTVHAKTFRCLFGRLLYWPEQSMTEVTFACGAAVGLDVIPEVVVGKLEDAREKCKQTAVNRLCEVVAELFDLVHEGLQAIGGAAGILPIRLVPVELLNSIGRATVTLQIDNVSVVLGSSTEFSAISP